MNEQQSLELTDEQRISNLLEEYKANIDLWIYEATFRQQRDQTFLTMNTILLVALSILMAISSSLLYSSVIAVLIAVFGLSACIMWHRILVRNGAYMRFRRYQLRGIEVQLQNVTTMRNQWKALNKHEQLSLEGLEDKFEIEKPARVSAIDIENRLPLALAGLWLIIFLGGAVVTGLSVTGWT
ncbi:MAG: hypothetical protein JSV36_19150 [Anaerolineae bacterium]|nr:MAG: hypothetical protein JSV36_19150 [Anaerolineae bacterium]